jgi:hypothetical protein
MLCAVAPLLQRLPVVLLLVKVTVPPAQNVVGPLAAMAGVLFVVSMTLITVEQVVLLKPSETVYVMVESPTGHTPLLASTVQVNALQLSPTLWGPGMDTAARQEVVGTNVTVSVQMIVGGITSTSSSQSWQLPVWPAPSRT